MAAPRSDGSSSSGSWRRIWRGRTEIRPVKLPRVSDQRRIHELEDVIWQIHRWLSIAFRRPSSPTSSQWESGKPPAWVVYSPLLPLFLLLFTGLYLFLLPYTARCAGARRRRIGANRNGQQEVGEGRKESRREASRPALSGNPQIAKGDGDAPVQAYIAAMPGWKRDVGRRLDALIVRTVPGVRKAVKWNSPFYGVEDQGGWFLSFHCFTKYIKVTFFRGASLRPVPPGESKQKEVRYLDIHEDGPLDETNSSLG